MRALRTPISGNWQRTVIAGLLAGLWGSHGFAQEVTTLDTVEVRAAAPSQGTEADRSVPRTTYRVGTETLGLESAGGTNPISAIAEVPGVLVTGADAYGLNNTPQNGQKGLRIRGEVSTHGFTGTVEGLSLAGPGPGPGSIFLIDKEDLASIEVGQGAIAASEGGLFTTSGSLNSSVLWPREAARREVSFGVGEDGFQRYFMRVDSGRTIYGTALFVSASKTSADKWRGYGEAPNGRDNMALGISQNWDKLQLKMLYANNDQDQNNYKPLTYQQAMNFGNSRHIDYSNNASTSDYYGYNRQDFNNQLLITELSYAFNDDTKFVFKPFLAKEKGYYLFAGSTSTQVQKWLIDHETYGFSSELSTILAGNKLKLGYSWTSADPPGPPTTQKLYTVTASGLVFNKWAMLNEVVERHEFQNYYLTGEREFDRLTVQGGIRYARETLPAINAYTAGSGSSWDVSADEAISRATYNAARSVDSRSFGRWLPQVGVSYRLNSTASVYANLGRNIGSPSLSVFNVTPAAGKTSQYYWDQIKPEMSTSLDVGAHLRYQDFFFDPTLYVSRSHNKAVSVYDASTNTVWAQNAGETMARGALLGAGWEPADNLKVFGSMSYTQSFFVEDFEGTSGATYSVDGRQLPDVPKLMANLGVAWKNHGVTVAPIIQYVGSRWGTVNYDQKLPSYMTLDMNLAYTQKTTWGSWEASLSLLNALDRKYISQIVTSETNVSSTGAIYYPGAPRTLVGKLAFVF
jgi:iron complex outermembrane recepter protein